jgi:uncharacterized protein YndB with AHSA1/START domain
MTKTNLSDTADREIVITRVIEAPQELVFEVWTNPEHVANWWGPNGFTNTIQEMDVRPGGKWRFIMHGPDGVDYPNRIVFEEIVEPERLVFKHGSDIDDDPNQFHVIVTFEGQGNTTKITMRSIFPSVDACEAVKRFGAMEGGHQTMARLQAYLAQQPVL